MEDILEKNFFHLFCLFRIFLIFAISQPEFGDKHCKDPKVLRGNGLFGQIFKELSNIYCLIFVFVRRVKALAHDKAVELRNEGSVWNLIQQIRNLSNKVNWILVDD